tara:strand:- start:78 stop:260 length:183 start_codon:yes stop_codon:yes gene_type:complete
MTKTKRRSDDCHQAKRDWQELTARYIGWHEIDAYVEDGWRINKDIGHHAAHAVLATKAVK